MTKIKLAFATLALALVAFLSVPATSAQASTLLNGIQTQNEQTAQPLEMRRYGGGYRRGGGWRRGGYGHRRMYRARPAYYGAYYAPRPVHCRVVVRYDRWGYPRRIRRCW